MRPCAWEDEEHDHIKLFTWAFCEKIISHKNFEKQVFVLVQTQGKWLKIMLKIAWKMWKKWIFFDFSKWLLIIIYHRSSAPKCPPDFRELFSSYIEAPNNFFEKNFWLQNCLWEAVFRYRACESLENELLWCSLQNRNVNTRSSGESVSFGGWKTWPYATFYLSFLRKNNFSSKFSKKSFWYGPPLRKIA